MTSRKIVIDECGKCPYKDHMGGFGKIAYIPRCCMVKPSRELPYTVGAMTVGDHSTMVTATQTPGIPDWCPLPEDTR